MKYQLSSGNHFKQSQIVLSIKSVKDDKTDLSI